MILFRRKPRPGRFAVKEGLDNLPSGICFADRNGTIILCNRQMYRLCYIMMGTDLQHITELCRALEEPQADVTVADKEKFLYRFPGGKLWKFSQSTVTDVNGAEYTQVQAVDVTELHEKRAELEREGLELKEANARARRLYAELDMIVREKETLAMKMRVHDDIGLCLLSTRNLLGNGGSPEDYRRAGARWEQTMRFIGIADRNTYRECPADAETALSELIASAAEIGVRIVVQGELPASEEHLFLFITAMRECVTNTVRHAGGNEMLVRFSRTRKSDIALITNNGKIPEKIITEGGGLSGLRLSIENAGGTMTVTSLPEFQLSVILPGKEEKR